MKRSRQGPVGAIRFLTSWLLYWAGHLLSIPMMRFDALAFLYRPYNSLMSASVAVQGDMTHGPWQASTTTEENCPIRDQQGEGQDGQVQNTMSNRLSNRLR